MAIRAAEKHKAETRKKLITGCPNCCGVLIVNEHDRIVPKMPTGYEEHMGIKEYRPGGGNKPLPQRENMMTYGVDPECALHEMGR